MQSNAVPASIDECRDQCVVGHKNDPQETAETSRTLAVKQAVCVVEGSPPQPRCDHSPVVHVDGCSFLVATQTDNGVHESRPRSHQHFYVLNLLVVPPVWSRLSIKNLHLRGPFCSSSSSRCTSLVVKDSRARTSIACYSILPKANGKQSR